MIHCTEEVSELVGTDGSGSQIEKTIETGVIEVLCVKSAIFEYSELIKCADLRLVIGPQGSADIGLHGHRNQRSGNSKR